jgi:putative ABC transport system permease protein
MKLYILKSLLKGKQKRVMLVVELFFSFLAFFLILTFIVMEINNTKYPLGFDSDNLYTLNWDINTTSNDWELIQKKQNEIVGFIKAHPNVRDFGRCNSSFFFTKGYMNPSKPLMANDVAISQTKINQILASDEIAEILGIGLLEGRWFSTEDNASKNRPVVLTQNLREELFGNTKALGEIVDYCGQQCIVVGVTNNIKHKGDFTQPNLTLFIRNTRVENLQYENWNCMSGSNCGNSNFLKCYEASDAFEAELTRKVSSNYPGFRIKLYSVEKIREKYIRSTWVPLIVVFLVITALFLNVLFGLFGVLWYNISQRRSEIGLRMAVGASKSHIYKHFIYEMLLLATIAIVPGIIVAIQFPILNLFSIDVMVYIIAIIVAAFVIYVLVTLCALLPSSRATKIQPAIALHEE